MTQSFEDRVEEVLGALHGMAWPLLEEPDKKKIVGKVAKGIDKGDTIAAWARALGVDARTIGRRVERFRRSDPIDGTSTPDDRSRQLRYEIGKASEDDLVAAFQDRKTATKLARAAIQHQNETEAEVNAETKRRAPGLVHRAGWNAVAGDLLRVRNLYAKALEAARSLDLSDEEADALMDEVNDIAQITGWFESWLQSGAADFDTELDKILEG